MGSIGPAEILVVLVVALIVLGPNRLPDAARSLGKAVNELRRVTSGVQAEVREAFSEAPPTYPTPPPPAAPAAEAPAAEAPAAGAPAVAGPARPEDADVTARADGEPPRPA